MSSDSYDVKFVGEKSYSAPILSLKGVKPGINPVNNTLTLKKNDVEEVQAFENMTSGVVTVQLYNDYNIVKTLQVYEGEDVLQMNTSDLPNGTYYLNISKDGTVITRQLVLIKH